MPVPAKKKRVTAIDLGIDLRSGDARAYFKWFLACLLFGKPIQQEVAVQTYRVFEQDGLLSPGDVLEAGWETLVEELDIGSYVRYDFSTATKLLDVCRKLQSEHDGSVRSIVQASQSAADRAQALQRFKGIGPVTARIFIEGLPAAATRHWRSKT